MTVLTHLKLKVLHCFCTLIAGFQFCDIFSRSFIICFVRSSIDGCGVQEKK